MFKLRTGARLRRGSEKAAALHGRLDSRPGAPSVQEQLRKIIKDNLLRTADLFRMWDLDGSGTVDKREFAESVAALGFNVAREEIDRLFDE